MGISSFLRPESRESSGMFVPDGAQFKELTDAPPNASINDLGKHMGYHPDQIHYYFGDNDPDSEIRGIIFELFSRNIIMVGTKKTVTTINKNSLTHFTRHLTERDLINSYSVSSSLNDGIKNKSLSSSFLARVLGMKGVERDGVFYSERLGLYLYFVDGVLTDFQASDGLGKWAKHFKQINSDIIDAFEAEARRYWGSDNKQVMAEINRQADALADIPDAMQNEYLPLHENTDGSYNFHMMLVCHYEQPIMLDEFLVINHGRYERVTERELGDTNAYKVGRFVYIFSAEGDLLFSDLDSAA
ncbi:hypothetical protein [Hymenobacter fodinae]|uniref:Uncharacterized protein n=1 Tax=Hymenobacter fodinae TaxID=2510796 RepID=A0A4Z0P3W8_9BACT|nr:hypothetical protein [Hymenobacter fodinae]TGE06100.1 hypothetical protein EU556_14630 [Hymenobacter fodinae]